jgi:chromatin remodeling complex protein RSC6
MAKSSEKSRFSTTIETDLLKQFKVVAALQGKRFNQFMEESIRDILAKYESKPSLPEKSLVPKVEKRAHSRVEVTWPVSIFTSRGSVEGEIRDISKGGALIHCKKLPETDRTLELSIEIPDHLMKISATVEKVRLNIDDSDKVFPSYDLAVRFLGIDIDQRRNLYKAIEHKSHVTGF